MNTKSIKKDISKWLNENEETITALGFVIEIMAIGGVIGYTVKGYRTQKFVNKQLVILQRGDGIYTRVFDRKTKQIVETITFTVDDFNKIVKGLKGATK